jgi:hypothetical protein
MDISKLLDKVSKKQIIAIVGMILELMVEVPANLDNMALWCYFGKIVSIAVITVFALTYQWSIDKKEKPNEKINNVPGDNPVIDNQ